MFYWQLKLTIEALRSRSRSRYRHVLTSRPWLTTIENICFYPTSINFYIPPDGISVNLSCQYQLTIKPSSYTYWVSQIDVYTLWNVIFLQLNETEIQFLLCMTQKALAKHNNKFIVLHVFKQTWRRNYHSMNVSGYWSVVGKWRMLLKFNDVGGLNSVQHHQQE